MSQYDPMGLICPLTIKLKIMLRCLYGPGLNLGWDEQIPEEHHRSWVEILSLFLQLGEIVLDRAVRPEDAVGYPELIGFADGSLEAYACAIYVRWKLPGGSYGDLDRGQLPLVVNCLGSLFSRDCSRLYGVLWIQNVATSQWQLIASAP